MCGGAILAELIPPTTRGASTGRAWPASSKSKKGVNHKRHQHAEVGDFEAAFEDFEDDFDLQAEEEDDDGHVVFASKTAFSNGNSRRLIDPVCSHQPIPIMFMGKKISLIVTIV
ncbi:hypothetical protein ACQ4PT_061828 [Festuca glaucescens]